MIYGTEIIVKRNVKSMGEYNRPIHTLQEVGRTKGLLSRVSKPTLSHLQAQSEALEVFTLLYKVKGDIKPNDILEIEGNVFTAGIPRKYKRHYEVEVTMKKEV